MVSSSQNKPKRFILPKHIPIVSSEDESGFRYGFCMFIPVSTGLVLHINR